MLLPVEYAIFHLQAWHFSFRIFQAAFVWSQSDIIQNTKRYTNSISTSGGLSGPPFFIVAAALQPRTDGL